MYIYTYFNDNDCMLYVHKNAVKRYQLFSWRQSIERASSFASEMLMTFFKNDSASLAWSHGLFMI